MLLGAVWKGGRCMNMYGGKRSPGKSTGYCEILYFQPPKGARQTSVGRCGA